MTLLHPAALLLPEMTADAFAELKADIAANGQLHPIVVDADGRIIDGRHRDQACTELGIRAKRETYTGSDPIAFVLSANVQRRHLTPSQRAAIAAEVRSLYEAEAKERQRAHGGTAPGRPTETLTPNRGEVSRGHHSGEAIAHAANKVGASRTSAERAARVMQADPALHERVKAGEVTVNAAAEKVARAAIINAPDANGHDRSAGAIAARQTRIAEMAGRGYTRDQIAGEVGLGVQRVANICRANDITIVADQVVGKRHRIDSTRIVRETVSALEGTAMGLDLIDWSQVDQSKVEGWAISLSDSLRSLNRFAKQLKEMARDQS